MVSLFSEVCVLPVMGGSCSSYSDKMELEDESVSTLSNKRQKKGYAYANFKRNYDELNKDNKELKKEVNKFKKDHDKVDAKNLKLGRDMADSKSAKVREFNELREKQKEEIVKLKSVQKNAIDVALTALNKSK